MLKPEWGYYLAIDTYWNEISLPISLSSIYPQNINFSVNNRTNCAVTSNTVNTIQCAVNTINTKVWWSIRV